MKLTVIDGNNWFRRRLESTGFGSPVRNCFYELQNKQGMVICVWDGFGALKKRRAIYPDYKMGRKPAGESIYESQDLLKKLLDLSSVYQIQIPEFEGDDVIAALVELYKPNFDSVYIETNDLDMYQLGVPMARDKFPEQPKWIRLYKAMVGDNSDNIGGSKGFGEVSWKKLTEDQKEVIEHILVCGWGYGPDQIEKMVAEFFPPKALAWFKEKENRQLLSKFYRIVGFEEVPKELIDQYLKKGLNAPHLAEPIFAEFML